MIYLDAAYIAKFYVDEPDSERVRAFLITAQPAVSCVHAIAEVASVFHRKLREGPVPQADFLFLLRSVRGRLRRRSVDMAARSSKASPMRLRKKC